MKGYKTLDLTNPIWMIIPLLIIVALIFTIFTHEGIDYQKYESTQDVETIRRQSDTLRNEIENLNKELDETYQFYIDYLEYLNRVNISFKPDNLREKSNIQLDQLEDMLNFTEFEKYAYIFIKAENTYNVNALFLVALAAHESAWGTSRLAREKNNLTGFTAYNHDPYNSGKSFKTPEDSIMTTASKISENYLTEEGKYFNGYGVEGVNTRYSLTDDGKINSEWSRGIRQIARDLRSEVVTKEKAIYVAKEKWFTDMMLAYSSATGVY